MSDIDHWPGKNQQLPDGVKERLMERYGLLWPSEHARMTAAKKRQGPPLQRYDVDEDDWVSICDVSPWQW